MTRDSSVFGVGRLGAWRILGWGVALLLLLLPLVAMQFTDEVDWTPGDFLFLAGLFGLIGVGLEVTARKAPNGAYRTAVGFAVLTAFLIIFASAAVGMIGSENNPLNLMFIGVLVLAFAGALLTRFRPRGMVWVMSAAAAAHFVASLIGAFSDIRGGVFSASFSVLWLMAAYFFNRAASSRPDSHMQNG